MSDGRKTTDTKMKTHTLILFAALVLGLASCGNSYNPKEIARIDEADELTAEQTDVALGWYEDALHREIAKLEADISNVRQDMLEGRASRIGKRAARAGSRESDYANAAVYRKHKDKIEELESTVEKLTSRLYEEMDKVREDLDR